MPSSVSRRRIDLPADVAFRRITAMRNHERLIPFTRVSAPDRPPRVGDRATAVSAGFFRDTMELVDLRPPEGSRPGYAGWSKRGPVLLGSADIVVTPVSQGRCVITWAERDIHVASLPAGWTQPWLTPLLGIMTAAALARLDRLTRSDESRRPGPAPRTT